MFCVPIAEILLSKPNSVWKSSRHHSNLLDAEIHNLNQQKMDAELMNNPVCSLPWLKGIGSCKFCQSESMQGNIYHENDAEIAR